MSGIFPTGADGGLPPNPSQPSNPTHAYPPVTAPADTAALYYGNGCEVRLRPEVLNSLISEIEATADAAGYAYKASTLTNLQTAVRYLIQRGLPEYAFLSEGPSAYAATLDPPALGYNDGMVLCIVPPITNIGAVTINANGRGPVPLLRNDGEQLRDGDLQVLRPTLIAYYGGAFYVIGYVRSQVPVFMTGDVDGWVRTDGNDDTGDGTANTPQKAFRTIAGAWKRLGQRYVMQQQFAANIRLGIPGNYAGAILTTTGGRVRIIGDAGAADPSLCKIDANAHFEGFTDMVGLQFFSVTAEVSNVTLRNMMPSSTRATTALHAVAGSNIGLNKVVFEQATNHPNSILLWGTAGSQISYFNNVTFNGNNTAIVAAVAVSQSGFGCSGAEPVTLNFNNLTFGGAGGAGVRADNLGVVILPNTTIGQGGCVGPRYLATTNSIINSGGNVLPGSTAGSVATGGQYIGP